MPVARDPARARTVGELRRSGYEPRTVKREIRDNLRRKLTRHDKLFPGVLGYERTVIPAIVNALLAEQDFILLGLRGQAKTRVLRALVELLDDEMPALEGSELNDDPFEPTSTWGRSRLADAGDDAPLVWLGRDERYSEKLATPDVSIADLLGDVDPIKAATHKLTYADPEVIHFGIVPRTNRGIFAINELPDLAPRIQVGLLNILEERDLQIRGFPVRIPLDILMVFSANPEDYTNRGTIITPLKDRISSQILTHYPDDVETAAEVTRQEAWIERTGQPIEIPELFRRLVEEVSFAARDSELVDQSSGVSARVSISALELLASNLERRALITGDDPVTPRICDLQMLLPALTGKLEMVYEGEQKGVEVVARQIIGEAVKKIFDETFPEVDRALGSGGEDDTGPYAEIVAWFADDNQLLLSDDQPFAEYQAALAAVPRLAELAEDRGETEQERALAAEMILEGLHLHLKLSRQNLDSQVTYKELVKFQLLRRQRAKSQRGDVN